MGPSEDAAVTALYSEPTEQNNQMQSSCRHLNVKFSREKNFPFHLHALEFFFSTQKNTIQSANLPKERKKKKRNIRQDKEHAQRTRTQCAVNQYANEDIRPHLNRVAISTTHRFNTAQKLPSPSCSSIPPSASLSPPSRLTCILLTFCSETLKTLFGDYCAFQAIIPLLQNVR